MSEAVKVIKDVTPTAENVKKVENKKMKFYIFNKLTDDNLKYLPRQATDILKNLKFEFGKEISEADVKKRVDELAKSNILITRQEPMRIFTYYRRRMIDNKAVVQLNK